MRGRSHVACAAAGWVLAAPSIATALGHVLGPVDLLASLAVAAGAGMGPDLDHPSATIARTHGVVSRLVAEAVQAVTGGHRHATHWLATGVAVAVAVSAAGSRWPRWTLAVALAVCGAWALRVVVPEELGRGFWAPVAAAGAGFAAYRLGGGGWWVGAAVGFGWWAHILCDWVGVEAGVPLFGPLDRRRHALGLLDRGGRLEVLIAGVAAAGAVLLTAFYLTSWSQPV